MSVIASELIGSVSIVGVSEAESSLLAMGAATDLAAASLAALEAACASASGVLASIADGAGVASGSFDLVATSAEAASGSLATVADGTGAAEAGLAAAATAASDAAASLTLLSEAAASADAAMSTSSGIAPSLAEIAPAADAAGIAIASLSSEAGTLGGYLDTLGPIAFTTGAGFDGLAASVDTASAALATVGAGSGDLAALAGTADATAVALDSMVSAADMTAASLTVLDASAASLSATYAGLTGDMGMLVGEVAALAPEADVLAASLDAVGASAGMAAASVGALQPALAGMTGGGAAASVAMHNVADATSASTATVRGAAEEFRNSAGMISLAAGLIVVAVGVMAVKASGDFQAAITRLYTTAGEAQSNLGMVGTGILAMAGDVGTGAQKLAEAMYWVESAGFHGASGLTILRIAAEGAKAENSDLIPVAHALTGVLNTYGNTGLTAAQAMNVLIASTGQGSMTLAQLSGAISNVLPAAAKFGLQLIDVTTGIAMMTNQNDNAASAATHLRQVILALESPAKAGAAALKSIGLSSQQVSDAMKKSLPDALQMIIDDLGKKFPVGSAAYNNALKNIAGGNKQLLGFLELTGPSLDKWRKAILAVKNAVDQGGNSVMGWNAVQGNFNTKVDQAKAAVGALFIQLGTNLLPVLTKIVGAIAPAVTGFTQWANSGHAAADALSMTGKYSQVVLPILMGLGAFLVAALIPAVWSLAAGVIAATWPFLAIGVAVAGLVAIFQHFYTTNAPFKSFVDNLVKGFQQAWTVIQTNFVPALQQAGNFLRTVVLPALQQVGAFLVSTFKPVWTQLADTWKQQVLPALQQLWTALQPALPLFKLLAMMIGGLLVGALVLLVGILAGVVKGWAGLISGAAIAFGGIIKIATGFASVIGGVIGFVVDLCTGKFSKLGGDLQNTWNGIKSMLGGVWDLISGIFRAAVGLVVGIVTGFIGTVIGIFQHLADAIVGHSIIVDLALGVIHWITYMRDVVIAYVVAFVSAFIARIQALRDQAIAHIQSLVTGFVAGVMHMRDLVIAYVTAFVSAFIVKVQSLRDQVIAKIQDLVSSLGSTFSSLAGQAIAWGANLIQGFISGILSKVGQVADAAAQIVKAAKSAIGFKSPAEKGEGRYIVQWGEGMIKGFSQGVVNAIPTLEAAVTLALHTGLLPLHAATTQAGPSFTPSLTVAPQIVVQPTPIYLDSRLLTRGLMPGIVSSIRTSTGVVGM